MIVTRMGLVFALAFWPLFIVWYALRGGWGEVRLQVRCDWAELRLWWRTGRIPR